MRILKPAVMAFAAAILSTPAMAQEGDALQTVAHATGQPLDVEYFEATMLQLAEREGVSGFSIAIINDNAVVYERAFGVANIETGEPVTTQTLFEFASMSKPVFGALVVDLAEEGVIDLDRPLAEYYPHPDLPDHPFAAQMTARQVLTHQTGLPNWRRDNADGQLDFAFEPGTGWRYSGEGYEYLADVLMHLLDTDDRGLDAIFRERIAAPAGATDTYFSQDAGRVARKAQGYAAGGRYSGDSDYAGGEFGAAYSVHSTPGDYARLMIGLMHGPSLSDSEREVFFAGQGVQFDSNNPGLQLGLVDHALGYAIYDLPIGRAFVHGGNNEGFTGQSLMIPESGWGFVIVSNEDQANDFTLQSAFILLGAAPPQ